jgi:hypothetical protein
MLSKLVLGIEPDDQHLTEIVDFKVEAKDEKAPESGSKPLPESRSWILQYRETPQLGTTADWLLATLGETQVPCNAGICTLTLTGTMIEGEIESHTAGGE